MTPYARVTVCHVCLHQCLLLVTCPPSILSHVPRHSCVLGGAMQASGGVVKNVSFPKLLTGNKGVIIRATTVGDKNGLIVFVGLGPSVPATALTVRVCFCTLRARSTLQSQCQNHSQKRRMLSPKTVTEGVFNCDFDFDSQEWICSYWEGGYLIHFTEKKRENQRV